MDDMLSNLPEALLILIISFLPLKDAVMTSVLSKQWLNLWTNTMSIDLNEDQFLETPKQRRLLRSGRKAWALHIKNMGLRRFADFVCQMLPCFEGPKISKFSLRFSYQTEYHYCMEEWIQFAISKKVEEIHLDLSDGDLPPDTTAFFESLFCLPDFLYEYKSLHVLKLDSCKFSPSNFQCFTTLSILSLRRIKLPQEVIEDVITNSPYLISLSLIECFDLYYLRISGLELPLKKLTVRDCMPLSLGIELCAPELQSFEYFGNMVTFYIDNLVSLSNVILHFGLESKFYYYGVELSDLLRDLNHAKSLTVCSYLIQVLPTEEALFNNLPWPLLNLKHLTLMVGLVRHELPGLLCLLRSSPNLETLTIQAGFESFLDDYIFPKCALMPSKYWESLRLTFNHLQSLRMVKMEGFQGDGNELELLKFLLEMAMVLETMKIIPAKHVSSRTDGGASPLIAKAVEELQNSEIASPNVEISFY